MSKDNYKEHIIIGAGIAGLNAAVKLKDAGEDFLVFEKGGSVGGTWKSKTFKNSIYELGPNTIIDKSERLRELIKKANLEDEILSSDLKDSKRYFYRNDGLLEISSNPLKLIFSKILGLKAKLRILQEPFIHSKSNESESVYEFFARRFGNDFAQHIVSTALQGVWGGDIKQLNMASALSFIYELEAKQGSVIKGFMFSKKDRKKQKRLRTISFKKGLESLCTGLALYIGKVQLNSELINVEKEGDLYKLIIRRGQNQEFYYCKELHLACPAYASAKALKTISPNLAKALSDVFYAPIFLYAFSLKKNLVQAHGQIFDAFGFLNTHSSHFTLGSIFASELFEERKIDDEYLFVNFLGGSKHPQIVDFSLEDLEAIAKREVKEILDNSLDMNLDLEDISSVESKLIAKAIPQYTNNYRRARTVIKDELTKTKGLELLGNYLNGVSIVDTIEDPKP